MPVTIEIPTAFRRFTDGTPKIDCSAPTIAEALNDLTTRFPALSRHVRDEEGQIRQFLNVYLNEEDIRFLGGEGLFAERGRSRLAGSIHRGGLDESGQGPQGTAKIFGGTAGLRPAGLSIRSNSAIMLRCRSGP